MACKILTIHSERFEKDKARQQTHKNDILRNRGFKLTTKGKEKSSAFERLFTVQSLKNKLIQGINPNLDIGMRE